MLYVAVSLVSCAALGYEVLLLRLFSITQWHHFAYMVISLALLGYGASGTLLSLAREWLLPRFERAFAAFAALFGLLAPGCFALAQRLPFNPLELVWNPRQLGYLVAVYLTLSLPFLCAAACIGLALSARQVDAHRIYRADLMGAGAGAALMVLALFLVSPAQCLRLLGGAGFAAAAAAGIGSSPRRWLGVAVLGLGASALWPEAWLSPQVSEYKGLSQALRLPGAVVAAERSGPLGLLTVVRSAQVPFRHAPGLSLACPYEPPEQLGLFTDGDSLTAIARHDGALRRDRYLEYLPSALPYRLVDGPEVLVLGAGGGIDVQAALHHGATLVDAVELNPQVVELVAGPFGGFAGPVYGDPRVRLHTAEARSFLTRTAGAHDLIQVSLLDSFGAASAGVHALSESYLYTVEALQELASGLKPGGVLAVTRWLTLPPRDALKLFATAVLALERMGVGDPGSRLALIRSWNTSTLLLKNGPLSPADIDRLRTFCRERWFDVDYYPGMPRREANRYNVLEEAYLYDGALALLGAGREDFLRRYKFFIRPATDDRPYFFHFFKWRTLPEFLGMGGRGGVPLVEWGYLVLVATLLQALGAGFLLLVLPAWATGRSRPRSSPAGWVTLYFACLGLAFLFLEMAFLQRFTLFLGHPVYAAAVVLSAFLVFAGLGAGWSGRLPPRQAAGIATVGIPVLSSVYVLVLPSLFRLLWPLPDPVRAGAAVLLIAPLAFCMGMPFPAGISKLKANAPDQIPWAWGINGWASVMSAVLATVLAIHFGFTAVVGAAAALYLAAGWSFKNL
jgi:spermidine synthase